MTSNLIEMSEDEFDDHYTLLTNHLNPHASWVYGDGPGCLFETYGEELEFVRQQDPHTVWTFVDGDDGDQYVLSGYHIVNRIGYLISTVAVPEGTDIQVHIPMPPAPDETDEPVPAATTADSLLSHIASQQLGIETLATRNSDSLDFHDVAVWQVSDALKAAYIAGLQTARRGVPSLATPPTPPASVLPPTPLLIPKGTPLIPGKMYLRLYHGRKDPTQEMDDWGFDGPTFGPLSCYVHTYCCTFRIHAETGTHELWLETHGDMIRWDSCFFGDIEVFVADRP